MDEESYTAKIFQAVQTIAKYFSRGLGIGGLAVIVSLSFTDKVHATYYHLDYARAAAYIDSQWYYFLDYGQYYYLDREQYNLIGKLDYFLGHPFYPKLYETELGRTVGFTNILNKGRFIFYGEQVPFSGYSIRSSYNFNSRNYFHIRLNYSLGRSYYQRQLETGIKIAEVHPVPEPSTIGFLGLGVFGILALRKKRRTLVAT
ncbi:MAG: PEP-CTERM sorting domain-containing protein [Planctomycetota bacterium]